MTQAAEATANQIPDMTEPTVNADLAKEWGMTADEYDHAVKMLNRTPTYTELGIIASMWSEHCSYKTSRLHLKKLPTKAPWVIQGPGENAGVIDIGDGQAAVFKMESHNSPSYLEPFQGAATGVGGIMRDVFTMGARPIANINALRFGDPSHPKTKHLCSGVVGGISSYGNCMGVPTVGGETNFHATYNGNPLCNAMTVGLAQADNIFYAAGAGVDQPVVYIGSKTGRDGIHGATMSSGELSDDDADDKRPTVQVGDPFTEKLLLEACLELMQEDAIISIQDMGAAGLTSSAVEIAAKGNIGVELDLDHVPMREENMSAYELMLSESQERMLLILKPGREEIAKRIMEKWDMDFAVIGRTTDTKRLVLNMYGKVWCDLPVDPLVDEAPEYDRPHEPTPAAEEIDNAEYALEKCGGVVAALKKIMSCADMSDKSWIWEQYDSLVMGQTTFSPGIYGTQNENTGDAALVRIPHPNDAHAKKGLAISSDCTPRYCYANPHEGGKQAVAESYRNICAIGAKPLAVTNNLNFGNPEEPRIMGQFVGCVEGMGEACKALDYPIISGNVSLYNATNSKSIYPTPVIGGVGVIENSEKAVGLGFADEDQHIYVVGGSHGHLGQSLYLREAFGVEKGDAPHVDLADEKKNGEFIRAMIEAGYITACHDVSDGGIACTLAEMALATDIGASVGGVDSAGFWFGEDQARYVVTIKTVDMAKFEVAAQEAKISLLEIGNTEGDALSFNKDSISLTELKEINSAFFKEFMG